MKNIINQRRSIRAYDSNRIVSQEDLLEIIKAGMQAPSARNQQPWNFIVIRNQKIIAELKNVSKGGQAIEDSRLVIALTMKKKAELVSPDFKLEDMSACIQNMMLAAASLKIGSCWIGIAPIKKRMKAAAKIIKKDIECFALLVLGYPKNPESIKFINRFDELKITYLD